MYACTSHHKHTEPTIKLLTCFQSVKKKLDIIQMTSTSYIKLGMYLLNDDNCDIVDGFKEKHITMTLWRLLELSTRSGSLVLEGNQ